MRLYATRGTAHRRCRLPDVEALPQAQQKNLLLAQRQTTHRRQQLVDESFAVQAAIGFRVGALGVAFPRTGVRRVVIGGAEQSEDAPLHELATIPVANATLQHAVEQWRPFLRRAGGVFAREFHHRILHDIERIVTVAGGDFRHPERAALNAGEKLVERPVVVQINPPSAGRQPPFRGSNVPRSQRGTSSASCHLTASSNAVGPSVESPVRAVATPVEAAVRALTRVLETPGPPVEAVRPRTIGARREAILDAITAQIRAAFDAIAGPVEALGSTIRRALANIPGPRPGGPAIVAPVEAPIDTIPRAVEPVLYPIAGAIETVVDAVTFRLEAIGKLVPAGVARARGAGIIAILDPIAAMVQAIIDALATLIETVVDTITAVFRIGERGRERNRPDTEDSGNHKG